MKLILMQDFVIQSDLTEIKQKENLVKYANFLNQEVTKDLIVEYFNNIKLFEDEGELLKFMIL